MEYKIGEIFEYNGEWYQCIVGNSCENCAFNERKCYTVVDNGDPIGDCCADRRKDNKDVIFKKLEKIGEPYMLEDKKFQKYKVFKTPYIYHKIDCSWQSFADPYCISLEIKQNKEDMEEKKLKLKPFDIQKAKEGKSVCTRNGRKARIVRFDLKYKNYPIAAAVLDSDGDELIYTYTSEGIYDKGEISGLDLMMLSEKHEGWINIYKGDDKRVAIISNAYATQEEALNKIDEVLEATYITTTKIEWEE